MSTDKQKAEAIIHVRLDSDLHGQGKELADKKGMSLSALVRFLLISELEKSGLRK